MILSTSILGGRSLATSVLVRRKMKGWMIERRRAACFESPLSIGLAYLSSNFGSGGKRPGLTNSKIDQISLRRFSIGVPVRARRRSASSSLAACAVADSGFLIFCASSKMA